MRNHTLLLCFLLSGSAGCGDDGRPPTTPTPPANTAVSLAITGGADLIKVNESASLIATATMADGTTRTVTATWRSDNPSVARVDESGRVTGVSAGNATLTAEASGLSGRYSMRVVPDFAGQWRGADRIRTCTDDGDWEGVCADVVGQALPAVLILQQNREAVTGDADYDEARGPVNGSIDTGGTLRLSGRLSLLFEETVVDVNLSNWEGTTTNNGRLTGQSRLEISHPRLAGAWRMELDVTSQRGGTTGHGSVRPLASRIWARVPR